MKSMDVDVSFKPDVITSILDKGGYNRRTIFVVLTMVVANLIEFYDFGVLSGILPYWIRHGMVAGSTVAYLVTVVGAGGIIGALALPFMADRVGRKPMMIVSMITILISSPLVGFVPLGSSFDISVLVLRFILGFGIGAAYSITYTVVAEYMPTKYRGTMVGLVTGLLPLGSSLAALSVKFLLPISWRVPYYVSAVPTIVAIIMIFFIPDTPRYYYVHNKLDKAVKSLAWLTGKKNGESAEEYMNQLKDPANVAPKNPSFSEQLKTLIANPRALLLALAAGWATGWVWYTIIPYMTTYIAFSMNVTTATAAGIFSLVALVGVAGRFIEAGSLDWLGRKRTAMVFSLLAIIFMAIDIPYLGTPNFLWLFLPAYFVIDAIWVPVMTYPNELFPTGSRNSVSGSTYGSARVASMISPLLAAFAIGNLVSRMWMVWVANIIFYIIIFVLFALPITPETKGKPIVA